MSPLASPTAETTQLMHDYPPPTYLKHKPIFMMPYAPFDGQYEETDALYLSVGLAQWRDSDQTGEISAKVWRMPEEKWSRQSEELPIHRLADLCILVTKTLYQTHHTNAVDPIACLPAGTFEDQTEDLKLRKMANLPREFADSNLRIKERLRRLRDELNAADLT